jgi:hypothetical protein
MFLVPGPRGPLARGPVAANVRKAVNHAIHPIESVQHSTHECRVSPLIPE